MRKYGRRTDLEAHKTNMGDFWKAESKNKQEDCDLTDRSHFSLLFLQGSQFMAFRARLVGGRPSLGGSPLEAGVGEDLPRTVPEVRWSLGRGAEGEDAGRDSSTMGEGGGEEDWGREQKGNKNEYKGRIQCANPLLLRHPLPSAN